MPIVPPASPPSGPFYFAWVDPTETVFGSQHLVWDEEIFSAVRTLEEGKMPKLTLRIQNPMVGLLSANRKQWAWFSWFDGTEVVPLFFGRLIGAPTSLIGQIIEVDLIGWAHNYVQLKQQVAETLKVDPFWDPVCIQTKDRDNPDTILESRTQVYHVDHLTLQVSVSDIINAEDGNVDFTNDVALYNFVNQTIEDPPLIYAQMVADVSWTQNARGYVNFPTQTYQTYAGDGFMKDWPKPLQNIGGGYSVAFSQVVNTNRIESTEMITQSSSYTNKDKTHNDGDTLSINESWTFPSYASPFVQGFVVFQQVTPGFLDPFATDDDGDPAPINQPLSVDQSTMYCPVWSIQGSMTLLYKASRQRNERVVMTLKGNFQPTILDPTVSQDGETITRTLADVGVPLVNLRDWTDVAGTVVAVGAVVFPDFPSVPGGTTAQIAITGGLTSPFGQEPTFSDIPGVITQDNQAQWVSTGSTNPTDGNSDWVANEAVAAGTIILPRLPLWTTWFDLTEADRLLFIPVGTAVSVGTIVQTSAGFYQRCTISGITGGNAGSVFEPAWNNTWGGTTQDGSVTWTCIGNKLPTGNDFFMAKNNGTTGALWVIPQFGSNNTVLDQTVTDNTITWIYIGSGDIPAGGVPDNVTAAWYFPTTRGQRSLRYLIALLRARMLARARCVQTRFEVSFAAGVNSTVKMSSTLHDPRIPGGTCVGKNTLIELAVDGSGKARTSFTMKSCVGFDTTLTVVNGTGVYALPGVFQPGVQQMTGSTIVLPTLTDVGYTPPVATVVDDGVTFPITDPSVITIVDQVRGTLGAQAAGVGRAFAAAAQAAILPYEFPFIYQGISGAIQLATTRAILGADTVSLELSKAPIWRDLQLKPLDGGPYSSYYNVKLTTLQGPKQIDLGAVETVIVSSGGGGGGGSGGAVDVALAPSLFIDTDVIYHPSSSGGIATLAPHLFVDADTIYQASRAGGGTVLQPPVVQSTSFSLVIPATAGTVVGTVSATNSPTSWAITAGNSLGYFAINGSGVISVTSAGASGLTSTTYSLTVQATNSAGSGSATETIATGSGSTGFPTNASTGYSGSLTSTQGATTISAPGTYSNIHFTGPVVINASNVTLLNCFIDFTGASNSNANFGITVNSGLTGVLIHNCTLTGYGINSTQNQYGINFGDSTVTVDGCNFSFWGHSMYHTGAANITLQNCYGDRLTNQQNNPHYEHFYIGKATGSMLIQNNTLINQNGWTATIFMKTDFGPIGNITIQNNQLIGGGFTLYVEQTGFSITNVKVLNNAMGKGAFGYCYPGAQVASWSGNYDYITHAVVNKA